MIRLTAVTLAALYIVLYIFGDEARLPDDVARTEPMALDVVGVTALASNEAFNIPVAVFLNKNFRTMD